VPADRRLTLAVEATGKATRIVNDVRKRTTILRVRAEADAVRPMGDLLNVCERGQENPDV
jgi:hypothetical protein